MPSLARRSISVLSLKARLWLGFVALIFVMILSFALLMADHHGMAVRSSEIALRSQQETVNAVHLQEVLSQVDRMARLGEVDTADITRFRRLLERLSAGETTPEGGRMLQALRSRFDSYAQAVLESPLTSQRRYEDVSSTVSAYTELHQNAIFEMADQLRLQQDQALRIGFWVLGIVLLTIAASAFKVISIITRPLSTLARFLDELDIEDDLPAHVPHLKEDIPELRQVARGVEQVLERLRGYRALNVRRLLIEKRRADIIAASNSDGVFLLRGQEVLYMNPVAQRLLGVKTGALRGGLEALSRSVEATDQSRRAARALTSAIAQTMPMEFAIEADDRKLYFLIQASPISFDVLEQISPSTGAESLGAFQPDTLVVARDMTLVRESQEAKGHFLATLSHEVKTPVTSLTLATRMLKKAVEQMPNPTHRALINTCVDDVDRLRGLLDELLTVSRFDILTQRLQFQPADLAKLVRHSVQSFRQQAFERGVELTVRLVAGSRKLEPVPMDPTKIAWALSNLLTNALRHTPRGGKVEVQLDFTHDDTAEIRVCDTGPGIDKKRQDRLFDRFNSFYDLRVARTGSAGTGLAIAREIVQSHGGRIWVMSEPGHGAQFCFTLPLKRKSVETMGPMENENAKVITISNAKGASGGTSARS